VWQVNLTNKMRTVYRMRQINLTIFIRNNAVRFCLRI
jgi:hypothetical protein